MNCGDLKVLCVQEIRRRWPSCVCRVAFGFGGFGNQRLRSSIFGDDYDATLCRCDTEPPQQPPLPPNRDAVAYHPPAIQNPPTQAPPILPFVTVPPNHFLSTNRHSANQQ